MSGTRPTVLPNCPASLTAPANNATGEDFALVTFEWTASNGGGTVESYDLYLDTNPNPTTKVGSYSETTAEIENLLSSTTYYWKVIAKNGAGESTDCTVYSFTTIANPLAPYCGPLVYLNGIEPITSVDFGGMTNTSLATIGASSAHEVFVDKIAVVEQDKSYTITLKGNTDGNYLSRFMVFIDWNQDGDFLDAGETYFENDLITIGNSTGEDAKTAVGTINVPATAVLGNTRMRIKKNYGAAAYPNPCYSAGTLAAGTNGGYGQAEDYMVLVKEPGMATSNTTKSQMSVYPNPVKEMLNIETADRKVTEVSFYSMDGKLVKTVKGNAAKVSVSTLSKGIYIVKVKTFDAEKSFKVIKD